MIVLKAAWAIVAEFGKAIPLKVWVALGMALALFVGATVALHNAYEAGRTFERQAAIVAAGKRIVEMEKTNEAFRALSARDRCLAFMRDSGLPASACDER